MNLHWGIGIRTSTGTPSHSELFRFTSPYFLSTNKSRIRFRLYGKRIPSVGQGYFLTFSESEISLFSRSIREPCEPLQEVVSIGGSPNDCRVAASSGNNVCLYLTYPNPETMFKTFATKQFRNTVSLVEPVPRVRHSCSK